MKTPSTAIALLLTAAFAGCASASNGAAAAHHEEEEADAQGEEAVSLEGVPAGVRRAVEAAVPGIAVTEAGKETDEGKLYYELSGTLEGAKVDVLVTPEGDVVAIERTVPADSVPEAARAAALKRLPGLVVDRAELIWKKDRTYYELRGKVGAKVYEIALTGTGEVLEVED